VCTHHNVESLLLRRRAELEGSPLRRAYMRRQARLVELEERRWCGRCALNVAVSETDAAALQAIVPSAPFAVVPNGVDTLTFRPDAGREEGIVFVGETTWYPNRDALEYFCHAILPCLRAQGVTARVRCVGRATPAARRRYLARFGVELTGYLPDIRSEVQSAACFIVPLRIGGGTRLKILDAWAMGKAVVSTSIGCEGLDARDGENILIRDTPQAFAAAVCAVVGDVALRRRLGAGGRRTVERQHDWNRIGESMLGHYDAILRSAPGALTRSGPALSASQESSPAGPRVKTR
jgi:glycosyltransferase involved in cell wall biosynthesis